MSVYIDPPRWPGHGRLWSHLVSDTSFAELHDFATRVGLDRRLFEGDHYDVPQDRYEQMLAAGAIAAPGHELVSRITAAGLRRRKRRGERVIDSVDLTGGGRIDTLLSGVPAVPPVSLSWFLVSHGERFLLLNDLVPALAGDRLATVPGVHQVAIVRRVDASARTVERQLVGQLQLTEALVPQALSQVERSVVADWVSPVYAAANAPSGVAPVIEHLSRLRA